MLISINGKITGQKEAAISVTNDAFLFGQAVFETIRTYGKQPFRLDDHLARLLVSADVINLSPKWGFDEARDEVTKLLKRSRAQDSKIRVILTKDDLIVMVEPLQEKPKEMYEKGVKMVSYPGKRSIPHAKLLADSFCYAAKQHALSCGAYESVFVDAKGYVRECAYANIFWVDGGELYATNKEILFGITRETVLELADGKGGAPEGCHFEGIKHKSILNADEVFITQTTSGILPVSEIDGKKIGDGKPGPVTKALMRRFDKRVTKG